MAELKAENRADWTDKGCREHGNKHRTRGPCQYRQTPDGSDCTCRNQPPEPRRKQSTFRIQESTHAEDGGACQHSAANREEGGDR